MKRYIYTISGFIVSIAFIAIGLMSGQQAGVLAKAARVCLECIGIG